MKVSPNQPFQLIYSLYNHEYLGYLIESYVVQLDDQDRLTYTHQNISTKNAPEFSTGLDENDYEMIKLTDSMAQEVIINHFSKKKMKPADFFLKVYDKENGNKPLQDEIRSYLERRRSKIMSLISGKMLFEMGRDGEPAWKQIHIQDEPASILFHFRKNEENTHYFPTIKHNDQKLEFQYKGSYIICSKPGWLVVDDKVYHFKKSVDGNKLRPFLNKKFIAVPKSMEDEYYRKFIAPLIESFDVFAKGFDIVTDRFDPKPSITITEIASLQKNLDLFNENKEDQENASNVLLELNFNYGDFKFKADQLNPISVEVEKNDDHYTFHRVKKNLDFEKEVVNEMRATGLPIKSSRITLSAPQAFQWIKDNSELIADFGIKIKQSNTNKKRYFLGRSELSLEVNESIDWFDINAIVRFGDFEIPFKTLRQYILAKKTEIPLPNGEVAVIPEAWFTEYSELFAFMEDDPKGDFALKKHHIALVKDLENNNLAKVTLDRKLNRLREFEEIEDYPIPSGFKGTLRPYQKAGFNWLQFLNKYNFGGCLADDMGLGKTVQTLAMLQGQKENSPELTSLLVMPTSLIYNWEMEAKRFTPKLKVLVYAGTNRVKDVSLFQKYDVVLTSYGIVRLDIDLLCKFYFNYIILDESQAIKNPESIISKSVRKLKSKSRLILTGTPIENSTLDLWSQMSFINPGLLGNQRFFKDQFLFPIEKKQDEQKSTRLHSIIKPFILRRDKTQVAKDLPEKVENIKYVTMTAMQEEMYEETKSLFRNKIMEEIEAKGVNKSQMVLLQGLTKLRQIANHPLLVDPEYAGDSGKLNDVTHMIHSALVKGHKMLIFSQFVKHLKIISDYLFQNKLQFAYLDGSTKDRQEQVERFQSQSDLQIFLISLKAGGLGLNLTKADYVFLLDPWWNPAVEAQAIDRAHRIGQENKVFTYKFITKNTVEEKILQLQEKKLRLVSDLINVEEGIMKNLTKDDVHNLLV
ncbi:MAG: SNF2-related protein [Cyclobacteriaceae bacterium]